MNELQVLPPERLEELRKLIVERAICRLNEKGWSFTFKDANSFYYFADVKFVGAEMADSDIYKPFTDECANEWKLLLEIYKKEQMSIANNEI
jgi:DNA-binding transcriptional regulator PaaX